MVVFARIANGGWKAVLTAATLLMSVHFLLCPSTALAEGNQPVPRAVAAKTKNKLIRTPSVEALGVFRPDFVKSGFFQDLELNVVENEPSVAATNEASKAVAGKAEALPESEYRGPLFVGDFKPEDLLPPEQDPRVRVNKDAPAPFIGMVVANQNGDRELAEKYADTWVRYQQNFFFEVRELTDLIGQSLIRQGVIQDDDWDGVGQLIDYEFAKSRKENGVIFKPTHDKAMERIKADPRGEAEIYYFFNMNCSYCRYMAPDVERLWRVVKSDPNAKMVALSMGPVRNDWIEEYRRYAGLTLPIFEGEKVAKAFRLKFAPVLVVVSPNNNQAYIKTGQQSFQHMYDFVRRVQGLPANLTPEVQQVMNTPIGEVELKQFAKQNVQPAREPQAGFVKTVSGEAAEVTHRGNKIEIDRF